MSDKFGTLAVKSCVFLANYFAITCRQLFADTSIFGTRVAGELDAIVRVFEKLSHILSNDSNIFQFVKKIGLALLFSK